VLTLENFNVTSEDVAGLRQSYQEAGYGDTLIRHLRKRGGDGLGKSQARLTRVIKLYDYICKLSSDPRYSHFFSEAANEFDELDRKATDFLRRAAIGLTLTERLRVAEKEGTYNELIQERREDFANSCRDMFRVLALFLAHAVLRSETSEMGVVRRLRTIGFDTAAPMNLPRFPIHSLTVLALGVFVYLLVAIVVFNRVMATPEQQNAAGLMTAVKVTSIRLGTIALTVWLMQRYPFFRRPRRSAALLRLSRERPHSGSGRCRHRSVVPPWQSRPARCGRRGPDPAQLCDVHGAGAVLRRLGRGYNAAQVAARRRGGWMRCGGGAGHGTHSGVFA
jgi:hypothetical protein